MTDDTNHPPASCRWRNIAAALLLVIGSFQMIGYITGWKTLKGLGAASGMAPYTKVFCDVDGLETFASSFTIEIETASGETIRREMTPELYGQLIGPYNRRNVYGAALSYAPRLPEKLWTTVFRFGLCEGGPLRTELGLPPDATRIKVVIQTKTDGRNDSWTLEAPCLR